MRKKRSQVSIEFLVIFSFAVLMLVPMIIIFQEERSITKQKVVIKQAEIIGLKILDEAERIYYLGPPSKSTLTGPSCGCCGPTWP